MLLCSIVKYHVDGADYCLISRVRTILALGYWVLGNICGYWIVSTVIGGYFLLLWHPILYRSDSSQHHPHDNHLEVCGAAVVSRDDRESGEGVECKLYIVTIIQFWDITWYSVLHCSKKKEATKLLAITLSNLNRFSKFFHCWKEEEMSNKIT